MILYSKTQAGFYQTDIHAEIPDDCVQVTDLEHKALVNAQSEGKVISFDETTQMPIAVEYKQISVNDALKISIARLEQTITPRRMREALLGVDDGWLSDIDQQISDLRAQLT